MARSGASGQGLCIAGGRVGCAGGPTLGYEIAVEESSSHGRLDMPVRTGGHVYLFEFKVVEMAPPGSALAQLRERDYAAKYRAGGEPIHLIGVEFGRETRNVTAFRGSGRLRRAS